MQACIDSGSAKRGNQASLFATMVAFLSFLIIVAFFLLYLPSIIFRAL